MKKIHHRSPSRSDLYAIERLESSPEGPHLRICRVVIKQDIQKLSNQEDETENEGNERGAGEGEKDEDTEDVKTNKEVKKRNKARKKARKRARKKAREKRKRTSACTPLCSTFTKSGPRNTKSRSTTGFTPPNTAWKTEASSTCATRRHLVLKPSRMS
jgi:hypothetical protein